MIVVWLFVLFASIFLMTGGIIYAVRFIREVWLHERFVRELGMRTMSQRRAMFNDLKREIAADLTTFAEEGLSSLSIEVKTRVLSLAVRKQYYALFDEGELTEGEFNDISDRLSTWLISEHYRHEVEVLDDGKIVINVELIAQPFDVYTAEEAPAM